MTAQRDLFSAPAIDPAPPSSPVRGSDFARFWAKVDRRGVADCWEWTAQTQQGYAYFRVGTKKVRAHRWVYEQFVGPIPLGMQLDHLCHDPASCSGGSACRHRRCVNPRHLALSTPLGNCQADRKVHWHSAKSHCSNGHPFTPENTHVSSKGWRYCRTCRRERERLRRALLRVAS